MIDNDIKREVAYEMLEDASLCFNMAAQPILNAKIYDKTARIFQTCAKGFLQDIYEEELLRKCLEECPL